MLELNERIFGLGLELVLSLSPLLFHLESCAACLLFGTRDSPTNVPLLLGR